jgi:hypothetical protein
MLPCPMLHSQSFPPTTPKRGISSYCALSLPRHARHSWSRPCCPALRPLPGPCSGGSSDPRLSPIRQPLCQHDNPSAKLAPLLQPVTSHRSPITISFVIRTYEKCAPNPFRIRTSKTQDLKPFRIRTYGKTPRGVPSLVYSEPRKATTHCPLLTPHSRPETMSAPGRQTSQRASVLGRCLDGRNS